MRGRRTPEQQARDTEQKRQRRAENKRRYGVCEPGRSYLFGKEVPRRVPDPDDYGHPLSDVSLGA